MQEDRIHDHTRAPPRRWQTQTISIDIDTGEILSPDQLHNYIRLSKETFTHERPTVTIKTIQWLCKRSGQQWLFND